MTKLCLGRTYFENMIEAMKQIEDDYVLVYMADAKGKPTYEGVIEQGKSELQWNEVLLEFTRGNLEAFDDKEII